MTDIPGGGMFMEECSFALIPEIVIEGLKLCYHCVWRRAIKTPDSTMFQLQSFLDGKYALMKK